MTIEFSKKRSLLTLKVVVDKTLDLSRLWGYKEGKELETVNKVNS